jgi:hypothetical protein
MGQVRKVVSETGTAKLVAAASDVRFHLRLFNGYFSSAYAEGFVDVTETDSNATPLATLGGLRATEGGYQFYVWNGYHTSTTGCRLATYVSGNSCTGVFTLEYEAK